MIFYWEILMLWGFEGIFGLMCIGNAFVHTTFFHIDPKINLGSKWEWNINICLEPTIGCICLTVQGCFEYLIEVMV
jgi:hypothetical protein